MNTMRKASAPGPEVYGYESVGVDPNVNREKCCGPVKHERSYIPGQMLHSQPSRLQILLGASTSPGPDPQPHPYPEASLSKY